MEEEIEITAVEPAPDVAPPPDIVEEEVVFDVPGEEEAPEQAEAEQIIEPQDENEVMLQTEEVMPEVAEPVPEMKEEKVAEPVPEMKEEKVAEPPRETPAKKPEPVPVKVAPKTPRRSKSSSSLSADLAGLAKLKTKKRDKAKITAQSIGKLDSLAASILKTSKKPKPSKTAAALSELASSVTTRRKKKTTPRSTLALHALTAKTTRKRTVKATPSISSKKKKLDPLEADVVEIKVAPPAKKTKPVVVKKEAVADVMSTYSKELEEAEFYIQQDLLDEAKKIYDSLLERSPNQPEILEKRKALDAIPVKEPIETEEIKVEQAAPVEVEVNETSQEETPVPEEIQVDETTEFESPDAVVIEGSEESDDTAGMLDFGLGEEMAGVRSSAFDDEEEGEDFFNLDGDSAEEGGELFAEEPESPDKSTEHSLEELFDEFKKGVEEQVSSEDYETHYNLGIAYKEMGLIDEAVSEFEKAAKDNSMFLQCCSMIGLCYMEKQDYELAVQQFQNGINTPGYRPDEYQGLQYDLGLTFELMGNVEEAFKSFSLVHNSDPKFREVSSKLRELRKKVKKGKNKFSSSTGGNVSYV